MKISSTGLAAIKEWEGFENKMYIDSGGAPTIGVGHLLTVSERRSGKLYISGEVVRYADGLTDAQVNQILLQDTASVQNTVSSAVIVPLTQNQFDALVSFCLNVGDRAFRNSTLLRLLNLGKYDEVPAQLRRWVNDNGVKVPGLVNRREKEILLWNGEWRAKNGN